MTPADIVTRLFSSKGVTADRVKKAQGLAARSRMDWADVLATMTDEQRRQVEAV